MPGWPEIVNLRADPYEKAPRESGMYIRWYGDNIWLFVPVQQKLKQFLSTLSEYPFQQGSSLNAAGINYNSLQAMQAMKRLHQLESRCRHQPTESASPQRLSQRNPSRMERSSHEDQTRRIHRIIMTIVSVARSWPRRVF